MKESLEGWRYVNERDTGEKMRGVEVAKVEEFKYLCSL